MSTIEPWVFCREIGADVMRMRCMFCGYGHMLECHWPLTCDEADCSHYQEEMSHED